MRCAAHIFLLVLVLSAAYVHSLPGIKIVGNRIMDANGRNVTLRGVNRSGTEFMCVQGYGFFDGPTDQNSINNMKAWKINVVRVPLNEDCWLNINGVKSQYAGQAYISAVAQYVDLLVQNNLYVILDLHWTAAGGKQATGQDPMPNRDHSVDFWKSVASYYKGNPAVIFDLFNEPFPNGGTWNDDGAWNCFRNGGGACSGLDYQAAGLQDLADAVRSTGASNILMVGGLAWSNSFAQWLKYKIDDKLNQVAASWHSYNFNYCSNENCWNQYVLPIAAQVPVITGESGENDCGHNYVDSLMQWADQHGVHYLGWTWNTWDCGSGPALITDYNGNPTGYGQGLKNHLNSVV